MRSPGKWVGAVYLGIALWLAAVLVTVIAFGSQGWGWFGFAIGASYVVITTGIAIQGWRLVSGAWLVVLRQPSLLDGMLAGLLLLLAFGLTLLSIACLAFMAATHDYELRNWFGFSVYAPIALFCWIAWVRPASRGPRRRVSRADRPSPEHPPDETQS